MKHCIDASVWKSFFINIGIRKCTWQLSGHKPMCLSLQIKTWQSTNSTAFSAGRKKFKLKVESNRDLEIKQLFSLKIFKNDCHSHSSKYSSFVMEIFYKLLICWDHTAFTAGLHPGGNVLRHSTDHKSINQPSLVQTTEKPSSMPDPKASQTVVIPDNV